MRDKQADVVVGHRGQAKAARIGRVGEQFGRTLAVNLKGAFLVARATIPLLRASRGNLVFTGSTSSLAGARGQGAYCASKAGIVGLARVLADELAEDGIRVNAVCPGWVDTRSTTQSGRTAAGTHWPKPSSTSPSRLSS
jgi:meso-butanediol dehydrogenase / (S,S)-butanediol dehydrogenase / diacetyl reductase